MRVYRERLGAPASWWLIGMACVILVGTLLATTLWVEFGLPLGVIGYVVLIAGSAAMLLAWGGVTVEVTDAELRAGRQRLPLERVSLVAALDADQARELRGPRADPAAYLLIRPYLKRAVYVEATGEPSARPYWLIGTRNPEKLAAAIEHARPAAGSSPAWHDVAGDHAAKAGAPTPAGEPDPGKDS